MSMKKRKRSGKCRSAPMPHANVQYSPNDSKDYCTPARFLSSFFSLTSTGEPKRMERSLAQWAICIYGITPNTPHWTIAMLALMACPQPIPQPEATKPACAEETNPTERAGNNYQNVQNAFKAA